MARVNSLAGWEEPGQTPVFDEYTLLLAGTPRVPTKEGGIDVSAGQAVLRIKVHGYAFCRGLRTGINPRASNAAHEQTYFIAMLRTTAHAIDQR